jgi:membrane fusion protein (multidrug efflux system)
LNCNGEQRVAIAERVPFLSETRFLSEEAAEAPVEDTAKRSPFANPRTRARLMIAAALALAGALAWFVHHQLVGRYMESTNNAYIQADAVVVSSKVSGYVDELFVLDNQRVAAGQPLLRIDPRDYKAQSSQFSAQAAIADAQGTAADAQIDEQQAGIAAARADLEAAVADADFAAAEVARYAPLVSSGAESRERLAMLRKQARQASAKAAGARATLAGAERRIGVLQAQRAQARAQGAAARAQLAAANVDLGSTLIRASTAGRIGNKTVRVGQFVQPATRLMTVVPDHFYITANFKETQIGLMRGGQPVRIEVDSLPGLELHGVVQSMSPGTGAQFSLLPPQNATGNFTKIVQRVPVRISIKAGPETRARLVPGMSVEVTVDTRSGRSIRDDVEHEQDVLGRVP